MVKPEDERKGKMIEFINGLRRHATGRKLSALCRNASAIVFAMVLVVTDAIPVPNGLPDTAEAAGPDKGTITFYEYKRITTFEQLNPGDNRWRDTLMMYQIGDNSDWYAPKDKILSQDNWPTGKVAELIPGFDSSADAFYSRTKLYFRRDCSPDWGVLKMPIFLNTVASDGSSMAIKADHGNQPIFPINNGYVYPFEAVAPYGVGTSSAAWGMVYVYGDTKREEGTLLHGDSQKIYGGGNRGTLFRFYDVNRLTYTCINSNYTIGDNQVYVADKDLFLKEGVKLTIPDGSVLCVKNGPFYVNGEIECYGTILVEDGGIIMPYQSESGGSRIVMKEGGAMIIRHGGRVYAGCPKGSLGTKGDNGWLDMNAGSSIINFGLFVAGKCNFKYGQATIENHKGGKMYLGYSINDSGRSTFMYDNFDDSGSSDGFGIMGAVSLITTTEKFELFNLEKTGATVYYGVGDNKTVIKVWDGAHTMFANKATSAGNTVKMYSYDKDGKCTISEFSPD